MPWMIQLGDAAERLAHGQRDGPSELPEYRGRDRGPLRIRNVGYVDDAVVAVVVLQKLLVERVRPVVPDGVLDRRGARVSPQVAVSAEGLAPERESSLAVHVGEGVRAVRADQGQDRRVRVLVGQPP